MKKREQVYTIDDYSYRSQFRSWNPELKSVTALVALLFGIWASNLTVSIWLIATSAIVTVCGGRVTIKDYLALLKIPLVFILLSCTAIAVQLGSEHWWQLYVTKASVTEAVMVAMRTWGAISILYLLVLSTPVHEVISVLRKIRVPSVMTELMILIYRYIFLLVEAQRTIRYAAESRLGYVDFKTSCRTFGRSMGGLLMMSMKKAGSYYDAMLSRCYDGELCFLGEEKPVTTGQVLWVLIYLGSIWLVYYFA